MSSQPRRGARAATWVVAAVAWFGMGLQFYVSHGLMRANGHGLAHIVLRYFSYFTVLTNALVVLTMTLPLVAPGSRAARFFSHPSARAGVASYIALVGIAYSLLLRHVWSPQGLARISDQIQHDIVPILYVVFWTAFEPKGSLRWTDVSRWLIYPAIYLGLALIQGAWTGFYPYHFIDAGKLGYPRALAGMWGLVVAFVAIGLAVLGLDRALGRPGARAGGVRAS